MKKDFQCFDLSGNNFSCYSHRYEVNKEITTHGFKVSDYKHCSFN